MLSHLPVWWGTSCLRIVIEPVLYQKPCNFPCPALIAWTYRECLGELVHLSIRCSLALVCWLICFLWEVTSRFYFYIILNFAIRKAILPRGWGYFYFSSYVGLCPASIVYPKNIWTVADPGPLMLGVLDRWTPTVNILLTLIAQISFHIELSPIEARYSISLYTTPLSIWFSGFRDCFSIYFV